MDSFYSFLPSQTIDIVSAGQTHKPATFLTFFAAAQRFGVLFLPFGWDAGRDNLGQGATSQVTEGLVDIQNSFAFKRTSPDKSADESFRALINEMAVLTHPAIRLHPLIPQLQGISWEICPGDDRGEEQVDEVWPVLVFEKSQLGDLWNMATLPVGREMSFDQRLDLCLDIATALHDIHVLSQSHEPGSWLAMKGY